jgi:peptidoglycan/LPS O-acetylase OafA/YrhL
VPGVGVLAVWLAIVFDQWFEPVGLSVLPYHAARIFSLTSGPLACALFLPAATLIRDPAVVFASPVRRLSERAYPIYLVHLPLLDAVSQWHVRYGLSLAACVILAAVLIVGISHVPHRWIEVPIMVRRPRQYPVGFMSSATAPNPVGLN